MKYADIDHRKTAFIFELDNVLYPEKDYLFQVYFLFAALLEYTGSIDAKQATKILTDTYINKGNAFAFEELREQLFINEKYLVNLNELLKNAKLPLKLLLFKDMLSLLQQIVIDRKKIFIVTNGDPQQQLNKIKQTEWQGLEKYLKCYFADEITPKPATGTIEHLMEENKIQRRDVIIVGNSDIDLLCAQDCGIDYIDSKEFINTYHN